MRPEVREIVVSILRREGIEPTEEAIRGVEVGEKLAFSQFIVEIGKMMERKFGEPETEKLVEHVVKNLAEAYIG